MKLVYASIFLSMLFLTGAESQAGKISFSAAVRADFMDKGKSDIILHFAESADLSALPRNTNRVSRLNSAYQTLKAQAKKSQFATVQYLTKNKIPFQSFYIVNAIAIDNASPRLLAALPLQSSAVRVNKNFRFQAIDERTNSQKSQQPMPLGIQDNLKAIGADRVWNELNVRGEGIIVAGEDTGYDWEHPALKRQYRGYNGVSAFHNFSWHDSIHRSLAEIKQSECTKDSAAPCDDRGHGTHTMGTILGADPQGNIIGVAPEAKWIGCRNMDNGVGTVTTYLECFEFFLAPYPIGGNPQKDGRPDLAPHIINNSWGCPPSEGCRGDEFVSAIRALQNAGILFIASAGNDGDSCGTVNAPPANYSGEIISVAASDHRNGQIADFSSRGPSNFNGSVGPTITAPGVNVYSSIPKGTGWGQNDLYESKSGTSMAGPHLAGVAALLWSARPELIGKIPETMEILYRSADPKTTSQNCGKFPGNAIPNAVFGYGIVNAYKAVTYKK